MEDKELLQKSKEVIEERGWNTGELINVSGECCLMGAIYIAKTDKIPQLNTSYGLFDEIISESVVETMKKCAFGYKFNRYRDIEKIKTGSQLYEINDGCKSKEQLFDILDCAISKLD